MNVQEFAEFLVTNIAKEADLVKVKTFNNGEEIVLEIMVSESDMPRVIGRHGKVANSIKDLIQVKAYNDGINDLSVNIDSF